MLIRLENNYVICFELYAVNFFYIYLTFSNATVCSKLSRIYIRE